MYLVPWACVLESPSLVLVSHSCLDWIIMVQVYTLVLRLSEYQSYFLQMCSRSCQSNEASIMRGYGCFDCCPLLTMDLIRQPWHLWWPWWKAVPEFHKEDIIRSITYSLTSPGVIFPTKKHQHTNLWNFVGAN